MDKKTNFAVCSVLAYYDATASQIVIDNYDSLPDVPFDIAWYDDKNYPRRYDDPNVEIDRVTARVDGTLTLANTAGNRTPQQGTSASTKNTPGGQYKIISGFTKKDWDDLEAAMMDVGSAYAWITEHDAAGDGTTDDRAAFAAALTAARTYIVVPSGTYRFGSNFDAGDSVWLLMLPGAKLSPDSGITVQANIIAANHDIKDGSGTLTLKSRTILRFDRWIDGTSDLLELTGDLKITGADIVLRAQRLTNGTTAPTTGTWAQGDIVLNSAPATASALYWRCTTAGTPGTWEAVTAGGGWVKKESSEISVDSIGLKTCEITHNQASAPAISDIIVQLSISSGLNVSDLPGGRDVYPFEVTSTIIKCYVYISDAGATGTKCKVTAWIKT